jgi:hypothetical protein
VARPWGIPRSVVRSFGLHVIQLQLRMLKLDEAGRLSGRDPAAQSLTKPFLAASSKALKMA